MSGQGQGTPKLGCSMTLLKVAGVVMALVMAAFALDWGGASGYGKETLLRLPSHDRTQPHYQEDVNAQGGIV